MLFVLLIRPTLNIFLSYVQAYEAYKPYQYLPFCVCSGDCQIPIRIMSLSILCLSVQVSAFIGALCVCSGRRTIISTDHYACTVRPSSIKLLSVL